MTALRGPVSALRAFARAAPKASASLERCDLCGAAVHANHEHVVGDGHELSCACEACAVASPEARRVRRFVRRLASTAPSSAVMRALGVPIELAFFFVASMPVERLVGRYPSAAGAVEASLPDDARTLLSAALPMASSLAPDVEALIVECRRDVTYRVSIDVAFELVARLRGARDVATAIDTFFTELEEESRLG